MAQFENGYGHFTDDGLEYVITRPETPMPWVNVICNGDYGLVVSEAGSGYRFRNDSVPVPSGAPPFHCHT